LDFLCFIWLGGPSLWAGAGSFEAPDGQIGSSDEKALAPAPEICISAQSAVALRGICVATDLDDIPARPLWKR
jgi:hypothetical protein